MWMVWFGIIGAARGSDMVWFGVGEEQEIVTVWFGTRNSVVCELWYDL